MSEPSHALAPQHSLSACGAPVAHDDARADEVALHGAARRGCGASGLDVGAARWRSAASLACPRGPRPVLQAVRAREPDALFRLVLRETRARWASEQSVARPRASRTTCGHGGRGVRRLALRLLLPPSSHPDGEEERAP